MKAFQLPLHIAGFFGGAIFILSHCSVRETSSLTQARDTTVTVYGPYVALKLPVTKGVKMGNPIQLVASPKGLLYASNQTGEVYSLRDSDGDGLEDSAAMFCDVRTHGLRSPAGLAWNADTLFVGTAQEIRAFLDTDNDGRADSSWTFFGNIPQSEHPYEWTSGLSFGPDGWLYCALTTDSWNAAPASDPNALRGAIVRISPNGKKFERVAVGIRSVPGMDFNTYGDLFFLDNEGGGNPTEELNRLVRNSFYGHNKRKYSSDSSSVRRSEFDLQSEVAPSSLEFNKTGKDFGGEAGDLYVSYYGPGERWTRGSVGRVTVRRNPGGDYHFEEFTIADVPKLSDLAFGADGNLYLAHHGQADYWYNAIHKEQGGFYKLVYDPSASAKPNYIRVRKPLTFSTTAVEKGKQLFADIGCLGCHQVDGTTELLGPNLKGLSKNFSRSEVLEEIMKPSLRIKPSMGGVRMIKKDGTVLLGRVITADEQEVSFMLVGNKVVNVPRREINRMEDASKSLMFEGLLNGRREDERNALLDYLMTL